MREESEGELFNNMNLLKINDKKNVKNENIIDIRKKKIKKEEIDIKLKKSLKITQKNYFTETSENNFLHFFEPKTKNFYYFDLQENSGKIQEKINKRKKNHENTLNPKTSSKTGSKAIFDPFNKSPSKNNQKTQNKKKPENFIIKKVELKIPFTIPLHHTSLINPEGFILLLGGLQNNSSEIEFKASTYILDFENSTLVEISKMKNARAGMSSIYTNYGIFIIGGILDNFKVSKKCEIYDVEKNEFYEICDLNEPSMNSSLSLFENSFSDFFIIKFGGKIDEETLCNFVEVYNFEKNIWNIILENFQFPSSAVSLQICHNGLICFGGVFSDFKNKSNFGYYINFNDKNEFEVEEDFFRLENKGGFSGQAVIFGGYVFGLQNFVENDTVICGKKNIVCITEDDSFCLN